MANKKVSQLTSKPSVLVTDLFPIADPTTGQLFKTTISALGTAIGSGVSSVNTLVGAVVLDTDDIQELASPTNKWYTDTRSRAAISGGTGISYNSGTGVITNAVTSGQIATALGYTPADGANYLPLAGGTMGGAIFGTIATFASSTSVTALGITLSGATGDGVKITHSAGRAFNIQSSGSGFGILINNETASTSAPFTIQKQGASVITLTDAGAGSFASSLTASSFVKASGTSSQFLKADGSVDSTAYVSGSGIAGRYAIWDSSGVISYGCISAFNNITYVDCLGLNTQNGIEIEGNFGGGSGGLKIKSYDETTGKAFMEFINTSGVFRLGIEGSTGGGILPGSTAYATVLTSGLTAKNLEFGTNNTKRMTIDGTTGAVTLTGALSGTSATFAGTITNRGIVIDGANNGNVAKANWTRTDQSWSINNETNLRFYTSSGNTLSPTTQVLELASTGAATFSSSVTATNSGALVGTFNRTTSSGATLAIQVVGSTVGTLGSDTGGNGIFDISSVSGGVSSNGVQISRSGGTPTAFFSPSGNVGIGTTAPTGTYGRLSVAGGISILNDNNAKLEIGRYSSGIQNSYIKIGSNSNSLRITNSTDVADVFIFNNNGSSIQNGINVQLTKTGGTSIVFTLSLGSIGAWTPGYATIRVSGTRGGLQEHYAAMYFLKLVYFQGSNVTSVNNVSGDTGSASIGVTTAFTSGNTIMTITITDVGTSTDYMIADIDASFQTGVGSIT